MKKDAGQDRDRSRDRKQHFDLFDEFFLNDEEAGARADALLSIDRSMSRGKLPALNIGGFNDEL